MLRQRRPPQTDPAYLKWLRAQRCACGCLQGPPCDAAHIRSLSLKHNKSITGIGIKPDDKWALPLKHAHHMDQHGHNELQWWADHGVKDPFELAKTYYRKFKQEKKHGE